MIFLTGIILGWATAILVLMWYLTFRGSIGRLPSATARELPPATFSQIARDRRASLADLRDVRAVHVPEALSDFEMERS